MDLAEFLYTALLCQAMTNRNIYAAALLEQIYIGGCIAMHNLALMCIWLYVLYYRLENLFLQSP